MTRPPTSRTLLASVVCISVLIAGSSPKNSLAQTDVASLELSTPVQGELKAGEKHSYRISLGLGESLHVRVNVWSLRTAIKIFDPDNHQLFSESQIVGVQSARIFVIAEKAGSYRLEIGATGDTGTRGCYEAKVVALGTATAEDKSRFVSQQLEVEANRLVDQQTEHAFVESVGKYQKALRLWEALGDSEGEGVALHNIGTVYYLLGEKRKAITFFNQALSRIRASGNRAVESSVVNNLGVVSQDVGELHDALKYYEQSLALRRAMLRERQQVSPGIEALLLYHIALVYRDLGESQKALDYFRESVPLWGSDLVGQGHSFYGIGAVYARLGDTQQALHYFGQTRAIWQKQEADPNVPRSMALSQRASGIVTDIGAVYASMGNWQQALENYQQALKRARAEKFSHLEAHTLNKMGAAYLSTGDYQKALDCFHESLPVFQRTSDRVREADTLRGIGEAYRLSGELRKPLDYFDQALAIQQAIGDQRGEASTAYALARVQRDLGRLEEARAHIEAALRLIESLRNRIASHELRASYLASKQDYYEFYTDLLMLMDARQPSAGFAGMALQANERARARSLLDTLAEARTEIREGVQPLLLERERSLQNRLNAKSERLTRLLSGKHTQEDQEVATKEVESIVTEYREVQGQIRAASPHYSALTQPQLLSVAEIQTEVLDGETLLLEYALGEERSYLWAVTRDSFKSFELPKRAEIEQAARKVYELLTARNLHPVNESAVDRRNRLRQADEAYPRAAEKLSRMLLAPVAGHLVGNKRLLIVTEGALQYVPFGALTLPKTEGEINARWRARQERNHGVNITPLLATHDIVNVPSVSVLATLRKESERRTVPEKRLAVFADPVFSSSDPRLSGVVKGRATVELKMAMTDQAPARDFERSARESGVASFVRLRFSGDEAKGIAGFVPDSSRLVALDFAANRPTARNELSRYRVVHFATHGLINSTSPELSGLVLSLVDEEGHPVDGFLRLHEIYNLKLNADLVVLSACQTALGKEIKGEGLIGLTRGFMYAGSPRVVASLWRIDDRATAELMKRFYRGMFGPKNLSAAAALRTAQLEMLKEDGWEAPYYWAAFTLQGEWK